MNRTRAVAIAIIVGCLFGLIGWHLVATSTAATTAVVDTNPSRDYTEGWTPQASNSAGSATLSTEESSPTGAGQRTMAPRSPASNEDSRARSKKIKLRVVDHAGHALSQMRVKIGVVTPVRQLAPMPVGQDELAIDEITDTEGSIEFEAAVGDAVIVLAVDEGWSCVDLINDGDWRLRIDSPSRSATFRVTTVPDLLTVSLVPNGRVVVQVRYADGTPYREAISYGLRQGLPGSNATRLFTRTTLPDSSGTVHLSDCPVDGANTYLYLHCYSLRAGWATDTVVNHNFSEGVFVDVVIQPDDTPKYFAKLTFQGLGEESVEVNVRLPNGVSLGQFTQRGDGMWVSRPLGSPFQMQVFVTGNVAWTSDLLNIDQLGGQDFAVLPEKTGTVVLKVVDSDGTAIVPAALIRDPIRELDWTKPNRLLEVRTAGDYATADGAGVIQFRDVAPGRHSMKLQARGFEELDVAYSLHPGEVVDLGTIIMRRYAADEGKVNVRLIGVADFSGFLCGVDAFMSGPGIKPAAVDADGSMQIEGLQLRKYLIYVRRKGVRGVWSESIELSSDCPSAEITIDVSKPNALGNTVE